jgi:hypothetical protein
MFFYCIASFLNNFSEDYDVLNSYIKENFVLDGLPFPMKISSIKSFEQKNSHLQLKVNVLQVRKVYENIDESDETIMQVFPLRANPTVEKEKIINLVWVRFIDDEDFIEIEEESDDENEIFFEETENRENEYMSGLDKNKPGHFFLIKNIPTFIKNDERKGQRFLCFNCLMSFATKEGLKVHESNCFINKSQKVKIPLADGKSNILKFKNFQHKFKSPFIGFFDFESLLEKSDLKQCYRCSLNPDEQNCMHKSIIANTQTPICFSIIIIDAFNNIIFI